MHHARLKNILEELIVVDGPARLDFKYPTQAFGVSIGIETLLYFAFSTKKYGDIDLAFATLPLFNLKSNRFQSWPEPGHNLVAVLVQSCGRVYRIGERFEERHYRETKFRRR